MITKKLLLSRPFIKINACLIGYGLWIILSEHQIITHTMQAPLCFYNIPADHTMTAPDHIIIMVRASKKNLHQFDIYNSALHIDASHFVPGNNQVQMQKENLFLPDAINLINLIPSSLQIQLQKIE